MSESAAVVGANGCFSGGESGAPEVEVSPAAARCDQVSLEEVHAHEYSLHVAACRIAWPFVAKK
jgi:hypothetical protein